MGIVIGKFRKKKTTLEVLEKLDQNIKSIEEYRKDTELSQKKIVGRFIVISVGIYLLTAFVFYYYFFPASFYDKLFYIIHLILAPVIILSLKKILSWYYTRKMDKNQSRLSTLKDEKKKMLEKVMETETYKVAKNILEKFAPEQVRKGSYSLPLSSSEITPIKTIPSLAGLRQRNLSSSLNQSSRSVLKPTSNLPALPAPPGSNMTPTRINTALIPSGPIPYGMSSTPLPLARAILPRDRSVIDKMVEYLVGDGPSNRFALICKQCSSHNGMALREEFEYISFRCCYCFNLNHARKLRPQAPRLTLGMRPLPAPRSESSESEKNSPSDTDSEREEEEDEEAKPSKKITVVKEVTDLEEKISENEFMMQDKIDAVTESAAAEPQDGDRVDQKD